jgi:Uma2 family endonuclease
MSTLIARQPRPAIVYPDSDGKPMADNTLQFEYIVTIKGGLEALFADVQDVFVAGDLLWYPVEGEAAICTAPDVFVVFGRPRGYRGSYKQWEEGNIPPQVAFEILSPNNRFGEMLRKFEFYQQYGVEEYYVYDPNRGTLEGWLRQGDRLQEIPTMQGWVSPRLKVRFELVGSELHLYRPDGRKFATYVELEQQRAAAQAQVDKERRDREAAQAEVERLKSQLRALGVEPQS